MMKRIIILAVIMLVPLAGCAITQLPNEAELKGPEGVKKAIVLLRVTCEIESKPWEPFQSNDINANIVFAVGGFETGGEIRPSDLQLFLSSETRKQGWTYFLLEPGTYYLGLQSPRSAYWNFWGKYSPEIIPRFRFEIPDGAQSVYIGTLHLTGYGHAVYFVGFNFKRKGILSIESIDIDINNDQEMAENIIKKTFTGFGPPQVSIIQKHEGGTIYLRTPLPKPE